MNCGMTIPSYSETLLISYDSFHSPQGADYWTPIHLIQVQDMKKNASFLGGVKCDHYFVCFSRKDNFSTKDSIYK